MPYDRLSSHAHLNHRGFHAHLPLTEGWRFDEQVRREHQGKRSALVREHGGDTTRSWRRAATKAISARLGMSAEMLRKWGRHAEVDAGEAAEVPTETARELRRKCRELESTIEILTATPLQSLAKQYIRYEIRPCCRSR
jgi:transposase